MIRIKTNSKVTTKDKAGVPNGYLIPIFNVHDKFLSEPQYPMQVYLTVAAPRTVKGPHLHMKRWAYFTCIKGNIKIVSRINGEYSEHFSGEDYSFASIQIPAGIPAALVNIGNTDAYILNMPSPAWHIDDQDDHPVLFENYDFFGD